MDTHADARPPADPVEALAAHLVAEGHCDARTVDRARRVASESGGRLDKVLIQLGLVTERGLAAAYAALLGQGADLGTVVHLLPGQRRRDDLASVGVQADAQLAPGPARPGAVLLDQPLAGTAEL